MANDTPLNQSIDKAQKHYSSLFFLPSLKTALALTATLCIIIGLTTLPFFQTQQGLTDALLLGAGLFFATVIVDLVLSQAVLRHDAIFVLRRTLVVSLFSWLFWLPFLLLGALLGGFFGFMWWVKLCLLGFGAVVTLRAIVFMTVSSGGTGRGLVATLLAPLVCITPFSLFWAAHSVAPVDYLPFIVISAPLAVAAASVFLKRIDNIGKKTHNIPSLTFFRAFMTNWVTSQNGPLETCLENIGQDTDVDVSLLKFDASSSSNPKGAIIVPLVHPGPFKNIGSSVLPALLKEEYDKQCGCNACVMLGILGHELDAASQKQNYKIINQVIAAAHTQATIQQATPFVRVTDGAISVSCQVFGKTCLLSFTLAPKTTEDLPQELGDMVQQEAAKLGLDVIVVNDHNSLTQSTLVEASLQELAAAAVKCLKVVAAQPLASFQVGTATLHPSEFSLKDGMGTGGITATVVKVGEQKTAYIVIDGNNMVSGLREKIVAALKEAGFEDCEIFTTDTHAVSAVVLGGRGYHPVGEAMNHDTLIAHIKTVADAAKANLEPCTAGYQRLTVPQVRVIGGDFLGFITALIDKTIQQAKLMAPAIFGAEGLIFILLLSLL
jgi:putative membrane protein